MRRSNGLLRTDLLDANETISAAMSEALADSGNSPGARLERLYRGWLVTGNVMVDRTQLGEPDNVVIEDERDLDALILWAKSFHDAGVPIWAQLNHPRMPARGRSPHRCPNWRRSPARGVVADPHWRRSQRP
jgi:2,4-dienoyl-CoA reductase-like NADH-dependent reductase (Old Yellow Enzyme family)